jgi:hypothetical protein
MALLTSSNWLDALYGIPLQAFMLERFKILAVMESRVEPWFEEARVATTVTVLEQEASQEERDANIVRFVMFEQPLAELIPPTDDEAARQQSVEALRDLILVQTEPTSDLDGLRVRAILQADLRAALTNGARADDAEPEDDVTEREDE